MLFLTAHETQPMWHHAMPDMSGIKRQNGKWGMHSSSGIMQHDPPGASINALALMHCFMQPTRKSFYSPKSTLSRWCGGGMFWGLLNPTLCILFEPINSRNETPVLRSSCLFCGCENKGAVIFILVIFQDKPMFSHINGKLLPRLLEFYCWTYVYLEK